MAKTMARGALNEAVLRTYEEILADPNAMQHLKLGAAKALDAHLQATDPSRAPAREPGDEQAPDPFADMDEVEARRVKRARRAG